MTNEIMEIWKPLNAIKDLEGFNNYEVSSLGRVRSYHYDKINGKILRLSERAGNGTTYLRLGLLNQVTGKRKSFSIHRLVMLAFDYVDNHTELTVDHTNEDTFDNRLQNLQWMTAADNIRKSQSGSTLFENPDAVASEYLSGDTKLSDLAERYDCSIETIWRTVNKYSTQENTKKRRVFDNPLRREIAERYLGGLTLLEVAQEYDCATSMVSKVVKEYKRGELNELS